MSHIAKIKVQIKDLEALKAVAKSLGLEFVEGQKTYHWYGRSVGDDPLPEGFTKEDLGKCDHALRIKDQSAVKTKDAYGKCYEIGVVKSKVNGGYELLWDFWGGGFGLTDRVGTKGEKLVQGYAVEVAKRTAMRQGFRVVGQTVRADGKVELHVAK